MIRKSMRLSVSIALLAALAACGNDRPEGGSTLGIMGKAATQIVAQRKASSQPAPARDPAEMAASALRVNPGPLIMVTLESMGTTQVMAMTGENNGMRTYMTPNEQAVILRNGLLVATRGLGNDLSVAEASGPASLILAGRSGEAKRVMRYYSGDGLERPLPLDCRVGPGPKAGVTIESCEGFGAKIQNNYIVSGGRATVSRQWAGPKLGYLTIQTLR